MTDTSTQSQNMHASKNKIRPLSTCLVTGGAGFLGRNIAKQLLERGHKVTVLDRAKVNYEHPNLTAMVADLSDHAALEKACEGIDCVFHTAAIIELGGGSAVTEEYRNRSVNVNIKGTEAVIDACVKKGVKRLVYTSSNSVCFDGTPVTRLNSDSPYAKKVFDMYTETKMAAEKAVLATNGKNGLLTCAIRPCGIYGAESCIMLDKFVEQVAQGKLVAALGNANAVHDNSFVGNLVHGQILAAERMVEGNRACGRAYFITDNEPENYFDFFRPLIEGLGYKFPTRRIPEGLLIPVMELWQWLHFKFNFPKPIMSPMELIKVSRTHISTPDEPFEDLDYRPIVSVKEAMAICLPYCKTLHDKFKAKS